MIDIDRRRLPPRPPAFLPSIAAVLLAFVTGPIAAAPAPSPESGPRYPLIATIRIEIGDVFDRAAEKHRFYRLANTLHIETREAIVRRELLFDEGDPADPRVLYESERNLRRLQFLHDNSRIDTFPRPDGRVDVVVRTRDVWTTRPEASVRKDGDEVTGSFSFVEANVLGFGKVAGVTFKRDLDRDSGGLFYSDPRLAGTRWTLDGAYYSRSDGLLYGVGTSRPFFSLLTPRAGGGRGSYFSQVSTLQIDGEDAPGFRQRGTDVSFEYGHALRAGYDRVRRLTWRFRLEDDRFDCEPGEGLLDSDCTPGAPALEPQGGAGAAALPDDRKFRILEAEYRSRDIDYHKVNFLDKFDRFEDLNLGREWSGSIGVSPTTLGDEHTRVFFGFEYERWMRRGFAGYLRLRGFTSGRLLAGDVSDSITGVDLTHYYLGFENQTFVVHLAQTWGHNLDGDRQFLLGAESGLRGYDTRRFDGDKRLLLNVEDRLYLVFDWAHLLSIGVAAFADAGYVWRAGERQDLGDVVSDVGVGLRFDVTRGASGTVIRMDYAFPLNRLGREENPNGVFSVSSGVAF